MSTPRVLLPTPIEYTPIIPGSPQGQLLFDGSVSFKELLSLPTTMIYAHKDDECIFMLPIMYFCNRAVLFVEPVYPEKQQVIDLHPTWFNEKEELACGTATEEMMATIWKVKAERDKYINYDCMYPRIREIVGRGYAQNIFTHAPWGDYGHPHHRLLYRMVRDAAVELGKSVWFLGAVTSFEAESIEDVTDLSLDYTIGNYYIDDYRKFRQHYLDVDARGGRVTWTWELTDDLFPSGPRRLYRSVNRGVETIDPRIADYEASVPNYPW